MTSVTAYIKQYNVYAAGHAEHAALNQTGLDRVAESGRSNPYLPIHVALRLVFATCLYSINYLQL